MMTDRGVAQEDIEASTGIAQASLSRLFTGTRTHPSFAMVVQVAHAIGASLNEIAGISGEAASASERIALEKRLKRLALKVARLESILLQSWDVAREAAREQAVAVAPRATAKLAKKAKPRKKRR